VKLEILDERKADMVRGLAIDIVRWNTAEQKGYGKIYREFKRRVRIPHRYAEAMYQSAYTDLFYTPEERTVCWQRWESQLDRTLVLPDWVEDQLRAYHPPVAH